MEGSDNFSSDVNQMVDEYLAGAVEPTDESYAVNPQEVEKIRNESNRQKQKVMTDASRVKVDELVNEVRATKGMTTKQFNQLMEKFESLKSENDRLKSEVTNINANQTKANDRDIINNIREMERQLFSDEKISDPLLQDIFNDDIKKKVPEHYNNLVVREGRYFKPDESLAVLAFPKLVSELRKYRQKEQMQSEFLGGFDRGSQKDFGDVSFVRNDKDKRKLAMEVVKGLYNMGE